VLAPSPLVQSAVATRRNWLLALAAVVAGLMVLAREYPAYAARSRIEQTLAGDACDAERIAPQDQRAATSDQRSRMDAQRAACQTRRTGQERATACAGLVEALTAHQRPSGGYRSEDERQLASRIVESSLSASDLTLEPRAMPCADALVANQIWGAFVEAAARSDKAWESTTATSKDLAAALARRSPHLETPIPTALRERAEKGAQKALAWKISPEMRSAVALCDLVGSVGLDRGASCKLTAARLKALEDAAKPRWAPPVAAAPAAPASASESPTPSAAPPASAVVEPANTPVALPPPPAPASPDPTEDRR
jgi:hypothetical protein